MIWAAGIFILSASSLIVTVSGSSMLCYLLYNRFRLWLYIHRFLAHCISVVIVILVIVLAVSGCISSFEISVITTVVTVFVVLVISAVFSCCILCHNNFFVDGTVKIELAVTTAISAALTSVIAAAFLFWLLPSRLKLLFWHCRHG